MKKLLFSLLALSPLFSAFAADGTITSNPSPAVSNKPLEITISTVDMGSTVYCYSWCADVNGKGISPFTWDGVNSPEFQMSGSNGRYTFTISDIKTFYRLDDEQMEGLKKLGFIAKSSNGNQTTNLFVDVVQGRRDAYSGGEGTSANPFILKTSADLLALASTPGDWTSETYFRMDADIDGSGLTAPIGSLGSPFSATFNGNGHSIKNVRLNASTLGSSVGLFGAIHEGNISSLGVVDANITGATYVGILTGYLESGHIDRCFTSGNAKGSSICVGGLVGENVSGNIVNCYSGADVVNESDYATGGLVGKNRGVIRNAYSAGSVSGLDYVGGLVGANYGTVRNSFALNSKVTCYRDFAARFGGNNNARNDIENTYSWDGIVAGHSAWTSHGDHASTRESNVLGSEDQFGVLSGWDFNNVWEWISKNNAGYPSLRGLSNQKCLLPESYFSQSTGVGTECVSESVIYVGPNPTQGILTLSSSAGIGEYAMYSVSGQLILAGDADGVSEITISLENAPAGLYVLNVMNSNGHREIKKIIKN